MARPLSCFTLVAAAAMLSAGCSTPLPATASYGLSGVPALNDYCLAAQRLVSRTNYPVEVVIHDDFDDFVRSKAVIQGPQIQQYNWINADDMVVGVSCKLKSADHLNVSFGEGTAGPDGLCQDMNRAVFAEIRRRGVGLPFAAVMFEASENVSNTSEPGMTGPDWLKAYEATWVSDDNVLHVRAKGFRVDFTDPRFAKSPPQFRGIHYCHFLSPTYFAALLQGDAAAGVTIGQEVDLSRFPNRNAQ